VEAALDVQPKRRHGAWSQIVVYSIPDFRTTRSSPLLSVVEDNQADIVNLSFGGAEGLYTAAYNGGSDYTLPLRLEDEIFKQERARNYLCASSGDSGALDFHRSPIYHTSADRRWWLVPSW